MNPLVLNLRGLKFINKALVGENFQGIFCGISQRSYLIVLSILLIVHIIIGCGFQLCETSILQGLRQSPVKLLMVLSLFGITLICIIRRGFSNAIWVTLITAFSTLALAIAFGSKGNIGADLAVGSLIGIINFFIFITSVSILASSMIAGFITKNILLNGLGLISIVSALTIAFLDALLEIPTSLFARTGSVLVVSLTTLIAGYIAQQAVSEKHLFPQILSTAVAFVTFWGTNFRGADLTEANFSHAILKCSDFRQSILKRTYWRDAKGLEFARLGNTYLANPKIRQLVVSCDGQGQNFDGLDLTGVNLQDAELQDASFVGASLNQSNLRGANLSRAFLKQTQLDGADLTGATLTGAYIEDWGITSTTILDNVQCEYVYMRVPTKENPNPLRKPDNLRETFAEGEFAAFIQPFFDTLDLYHSQDVDPRAISIALSNLATNHPDDNLQFVAIERRGETGVNLRFTTTPKANKSELSEEYFTTYFQIRKELASAVQLKLAAQDAEIRTLQETVEQFIQAGAVTHRTEPTKSAEPFLTKSILMLTANPKGTPLLRLGEEARELQAGLERAKYRDRFTLQHRWAVTPTEVRRALLNIKPTIVHFSGHGLGTETGEQQEAETRKFTVVGNAMEPEGLVFENEKGEPHLVSGEMLSDLFALFADRIECVVLNVSSG